MLLKLYFLWLGTCRGTDLRKLLITFNVNVLSYSVWKSEKKEALHLNLEGVVLVHDLRKYIYIYIFFYLGFLSRTFTNHRTAGEGGGHLFISSLPLPPASQVLRQSGDYCRELTPTHSQQLYSNRKPLASEHKSLITKLCAQIKGYVWN